MTGKRDRAGFRCGCANGGLPLIDANLEVGEKLIKNETKGIRMSGSDQAHQDALNFINGYNACFYERDLDRLKTLYSSKDFTTFWDNHRGCDSVNLEDHFRKISRFFKNGKQTESGTIEPLVIENLRAFAVCDTLLVTAILRYHSAPVPGVRSTFALLKENDDWKAVHIHHSFDPNEED